MLGPLHFTIFMNVLVYSDVYLFADVTKVFNTLSQEIMENNYKVTQINHRNGYQNLPVKHMHMGKPEPDSDSKFTLKSKIIQ